MEPKWLQKSVKNSLRYLTRRLSVFGSKVVPKWSQNAAQYPRISWTFRVTLLRRLQEGHMEAKELENVAKMEGKGSQMEEKYRSEGATIDKKINEKWSRGVRRWVTFGNGFHSIFDGFPLDSKSVLLRFSIDFHRISNGQSSCRSGRDGLACV